LGAATLLAIVVFGAALAPASAAAPGEDPPAAQPGGFTAPVAGQVSYAEKGAFTISWNAGDVAAESWRVVRAHGYVDLDGGCAGVSYERDTALETTQTTVLMPKQYARRCYVYRVWPSTADPGSEPTYVSGTVRVLKPWTGTYNLYRTGVFSTQRTMTWCVAASVQMMLNIIHGRQDHSRESQERYIRFARKNDQYTTAEAKGTDAQGWAATLARFGGGTGYHSVSTQTYRSSIRSMARRMRETGKPVGLIVAHSGHAWVATGFEASADPAMDPSAEVTAVYVMGPLYPRQTRGGYDMPPNTRLSYDRLKSFHTRYYDSAGPKNPWENTFVTIQP
jgi:hypothetical protein